MSFFKVLHKSKKSKARLGEIRTAHGVIKTPAFVPVATKGTIKSLLPQLLSEIGVQVAFVNTYHLVTHPGADIIEEAGGIHQFSKLPVPLMSDSAGFQVFSLANNSKAASFRSSDQSLGTLAAPAEKNEALVVKISNDGVMFRSTVDGELLEFTPEKSIQYQKQIGADLIMAFDECTYYPATEKYARRAMERTHEWLKRCIREFRKLSFRAVSVEVEESLKKERDLLRSLRTIASTSVGMTNDLTSNQFIYGIIQGGTYKKLRKESAEFVTKQDVDGIAIGGVSVGESKGEMREQVRWVAPYLPDNKPVHLLGIGHADDIIDVVDEGIDTFDCVEPTRLARMGVLYALERVMSHVAGPVSRPPQNKTHQPMAGGPISGSRLETPATSYKIDINKTINKYNLEKVDEGCGCYVCQNFTKAYLHHLFKQRELLGYTLATYHNLWVMERFMEEIRKRIKTNDL